MRKWHISEGLVSIWESRYYPDMSLSRRVSQCGQTGGTWGDTNHGCTLTVLKRAVKKTKKTLPLCWDSVVDLVSMSLSWPSAVWILTVRKTPQQWAKLIARSACGRSSMTECHCSSQHCDVQSASTSRPWPALESRHNRGKFRIKQARRMIAATLQKNTEQEQIFFFPHWYTISLFLHSKCDVKVLMWAIFTVWQFSSSCLPYSIIHPHRWWEDRHLSERLWRHQYHHGCSETVPQGFACSHHLIRCLPQVHRGCK